MKKNNMKTAICILASLVLVISASIGLTACKKSDTAQSEEASTRPVLSTEQLTPEQRAEMESQLAKDDNVVEDPFDDEGGSASSKEKANGQSGEKATDSQAGSNAKGTNSKSSATAKEGETPTAKKSSGKTASKKSSGNSGNQSSGNSGEKSGNGGVLVTDESGNLWTGWY